MPLFLFTPKKVWKMEKNQKRNGLQLSGMRLKYIAMVCMLLDHVADGILLPLMKTSVTDALLQQYLCMRTIGRLAFPLYCFLTAQGVWHSHNIKQYAASLWGFALFSEIPFDLTAFGYPVWPHNQNVYFTLALAVTAYWLAINVKNPFMKGMALLATPAVAGLLHADYGMIGVLVLYACFFGNPWTQAAAGVGVIFLGVYKLYGAGFTACLLGLAISGIYIYLIRSYNGKRGKVRGNKYLYYAFYPVHLLVIGLFRIFFIGQ